MHSVGGGLGDWQVGGEAGGVGGGVDHGIHDHARNDPELVTAAVGAVHLVEAAHVGGPAAVGFEDFLFGVLGVFGEVLLEPLELSFAGGVYEDVEGAGNSGEDTGRA